MNFENILRGFRIYGDLENAEPYGSGHINDTYAVTVRQAGAPVRYIFQRINHHVFPHPAEMMDNIVRVCDHLREMARAEGAEDVSRRALTVIRTPDNMPYHRDDKGNFWRAYFFIEGALTYDVMESPMQAYHAARAFGAYQKALSTLPSPALYETIPDFHNGQKRFEKFKRALEADEHNRASMAKEEIDWLVDRAWVFERVPGLIESGELPVRITHNDCKINNVMLDDETGEGVCVIDLDTTMPGVVLYDFGDMVRTTTNPVAEDERDLSKVVVNQQNFEAILRGYLETAGDFLNEAERSNLVFSGELITQIIGTRFLTDFLEGDVYFKVHRENHNLDRARVQFQLVRSIVERAEELTALMDKVEV